MDKIYLSSAYDDYEKRIKAWRKHTIKFAEDILGIKLKWYQKIRFSILIGFHGRMNQKKKS